ncbi:MAG: hypothetical protein AAF543_21975 [Pseudomonadota bacterium]
MCAATKDGPLALLVGSRGDLLIQAVDRQISCLHLPPDDIVNHRVELDNDTLKLDGRVIDMLLLRCHPQSIIGESFVERDVAFVQGEMRAFMLAACHLETVYAPVMPDAVTWYEGMSWPVWRRTLKDADTALAAFRFGGAQSRGSWVPYRYGGRRLKPGDQLATMLGIATTDDEVAETYLLFEGKALGREAKWLDPDVGRTLREHGIDLAEVAVTEQGAVMSVDVLPNLEPSIADNVATRILERVHDHRTHWQ